MKHTANIICLVYIIFSMIILSYGCDDPATSKLSYLKNNNQQEDFEIQPEEEDGIDLEKETDTTTDTSTTKTQNSKTSEGKTSEISVKGGSIRVCIAYLGNGIVNYNDDKELMMFFNNSDSRIYSLNLNNNVKRTVKLYHNKKEIEVGYRVANWEETKLREDLITREIAQEDIESIIKHRVANHIPGTVYEGLTWKDNKFVIQSECARATCPNEKASISIIGDVEYTDGSKKYLRIDRKDFPINTTVEYKVDDFEIVHVKYDFDDYCSFINPTSIK